MDLHSDKVRTAIIHLQEAIIAYKISWKAREWRYDGKP
jgi:hypothetical protein